MYFPYLRGKQNELIGIRELATKELISRNVIPIVEPINLSSTLIITMKKFIEKNLKLGIVINPKVGAFQEDVELADEENQIYTEYKELLEHENFIKVYLMNKDSEEEIPLLKEEIESIIICIDDVDYLETYKTCFDSIKPLYTIMKDESSIRRVIRENRILLDDKFNKAHRNADYLDKEDEFFSEDHMYFKEDGYIGFSDFVIIGEEYKDGGFAPYAIAIHITYFDNDSKLRIRHFVSDSNDDISNPAGKFGEALSKLIDWVDENEIEETFALECFRELYTEKRYPNLGIVKKLSIMHHLELMNRYLLNENSIYAN